MLAVSWVAGEASARDSLRRGVGLALWFFLGLAAVMGTAIIYFWAHGALGDWVYDNFTFLFTNYRHYEISPGMYSWSRFNRLSQWLVEDPSLHNICYFMGYYSFAVACPVIAVCGALWKLARRGRLQGQRASLVLLFLLSGFGSFLAEIHNRDMVHLIRASPILLILMVDAWNEAFRSGGRVRRPLIFAGGFALVVVIMAAGMRIKHFSNWNSPVDTRRGRIYTDPEAAVAFRKWIDTIDRAVPPGGDAFFFPYHANLYYLTATRNPTRYDNLLSGFHSPQQIQEAISTLQSRKAGSYVFSFDYLMVWTPRDHLPDDPSDFNPPDTMEQSLQSPQSNYRKVEEVEGMEVWTLNR
jgi:hypothetical protein